MSDKKNTFESGKEYALAEIFSGVIRIVIPDLQRDYCWGDKVWDKDGRSCPELVAGFLRSLIDVFDEKKDKKLILGMIYGYEQPKGFIHLCDGQQRITTLFLLLGMLYRKTTKIKESIRDALIFSNIQDQDSNEPHLQYAIRESTLYFFSDLVSNLFLGKGCEINKITSQDWYFDEYNQDPTIQSMIGALKTIEKILVGDIDCDSFGDFILKDLQFLYYDMGNRSQGEETFVVINTTGEPLTATENLKPIVVTSQQAETQKECSRKWEEWETWFWKHRRGQGKKINTTADNGFNEFFRWVACLEESRRCTNKTRELFERILGKGLERGEVRPEELILYPFDNLQTYFKTVKCLFEDGGIFQHNRDWLAPAKNGNELVTWFKLLPVIAYVNRFGTDVDNLKIKRVARFFDNLVRVENDRREDILPAILLINAIATDDIATAIDLAKLPSLVTDEEKKKFAFYKNPPNNATRECLEEIFWKAEESKIWKGEILPMIHWATDDVFDVEQFKSLRNVFDGLFKNLDHASLDITRRALLTRKLQKYPRPNGGSNMSFCKAPEEWKALIKDNEAPIGDFMKKLLESSDVREMQSEMIKQYPETDKWADFVHRPEIINFCENKNIRWYGDARGWILIKRTNATKYANLKSYLLYLDLKKKGVGKHNGWGDLNFYDMDGSCACIDKESKNAAINLFYVGNEAYQLHVFRREPKTERFDEAWLLKLSNLFALQLNSKNNRYESLPQKRVDFENSLNAILQHTVES